MICTKEEGLAEYQYDSERFAQAMYFLKTIKQELEGLVSLETCSWAHKGAFLRLSEIDPTDIDEARYLISEIESCIHVAGACRPWDWEDTLFSIPWRINSEHRREIQHKHPRLFRQIDDLMNDSA